jgi:HAD superfamily hydrolase (TIGR01484 family)
VTARLVRRPAHWKRVGAVFTDLDDTLTNEAGAIPATVVAALERLAENGVRVVVATGRSAGWADALVRLLPVAGVVYETGGGLVERSGRRVTRTDLAPVGALASVGERFFRAFPDLVPAQDQPFRRTDMAIDVAEGRRVRKDRVEEALRWLRKEPGVRALASSVHVNFWRGDHSKATGCEHFRRRWRLPLGAVIACGDAPNDESLFERYPESVGLANLLPRLSELRHAPRYVTVRPRALGFCDLARLILPR